VFGIGTQEMLLILVLALIVFGPKKLPEMGKSIGKSLRQFNQATQDIRDEFRFNLDDDEEAAKPAEGAEFSPTETGSPNGSTLTGDGSSKTKTEAESEPGSPDPGPTA
jgi:sec-independent protein translocase protein TatA